MFLEKNILLILAYFISNFVSGMFFPNYKMSKGHKIELKGHRFATLRLQKRPNVMEGISIHKCK